MEVTTKSPRETQEVAKDLAKSLKIGTIVAIFGDLGAGKTVFVKGLAEGLGVKRKITSPTFVLMRSYPISGNRKRSTFYHLDLYRVKGVNDFKHLGLGEIFEEKAIFVLEWAERLGAYLPKRRINVFIKIAGDKKRRIRIEKH